MGTITRAAEKLKLPDSTFFRAQNFLLKFGTNINSHCKAAMTNNDIMIMIMFDSEELNRLLKGPF